MARHDGGCPGVGTMARALWWLWWNVLQKLDVEVLAWLVMESWSVADSSSQVCNLFLFSLYLHIVCIWFVLKQAHRLIRSSILNPQSSITPSHHHTISFSFISNGSIGSSTTNRTTSSSPTNATSLIRSMSLLHARTITPYSPTPSDEVCIALYLFSLPFTQMYTNIILWWDRSHQTHHKWQKFGL